MRRKGFILVNPKTSVSPPQTEPASTIIVTGTGFAPESQIRNVCGRGWRAKRLRGPAAGYATFNCGGP
jgi:hypothetical protein